MHGMYIYWLHMWQSIYWSSYDLDFAIFVDSILRLISMAVLPPSSPLSLLLPLPLSLCQLSIHNAFTYEFGLHIFNLLRLKMILFLILYYTIFMFPFYWKWWFTCWTPKSKRNHFCFWYLYNVRESLSQKLILLYYSHFVLLFFLRDWN